MPRTATFSLLVLALAGCTDLLRVPPPPVPLSAIDAPAASTDWEGEVTTTRANPPLLRAVAPGSLLTIQVPDIAGSVQRFRQTTLHDILTSPQLEQALGPITAGFRALSVTPGAAGAGGLDPTPLLRALQGEIVLSLEDVRIAERGGPPEVRVLVAMGVRGAEKEAEQLVEFLGMMTATDRSLTVEKGTHDGTPFTRIVARNPFPLVVELAVAGRALLAGLGRETVTSAITRLADDNAASVADGASLRRCMERCADPRDVFRLHLDLAGALSKFGRLLPPAALEVVRSIGLDHVQSVGAALRFEGKDVVVATLLDSPGGEDLLTKLFAGHVVDRQFLRRVPADASSFTLFAVDVPAVLAHLRTTLPPEGQAAMKEVLGKVRAAGFDPDKDVFEVFGPRCALVTLPGVRRDAKGIDRIWDQFLGTAIVVEIHDEVRAQASLAKLPAGGESLRRREEVVEGIPAVVYRFDAVTELPVEFALCYAIDDGYLVAALSQETLRRMLRARTPETAQRFREATQGVPESISILSYDDLRGGWGLAGDALMAGFAKAMADTGSPMPADFSLAPLLADLSPAVGYTIADERGTFSYARSPTGGLGGVGGLTGLLTTASIALPNLLMARAQANESSAITTLRTIRAAEDSYRARVARDTDGDGEGEYGLLSDLSALPRPGEKRATLRDPLLSGLTKVDGGGWTRAGYFFRAYLPSEDGSPIGDHEGAARIPHIDGDLAETVLVVVAWPVHRTATGKRAFLLDADGQIWQCADSPYGEENAPPPDLLSSQKGNLASRPISSGDTPRDGLAWQKVR